MIEREVKEKSGWLEKPGNIRKLKVAFGIVLGLLVALDWVIHKHAYFHLEGFIGFYAIYGFVSCAIIVALSKILKMLRLTKQVGYYDD